MAVVTGSNGELRYNGTRIAKCRNFSLNINRDALETTTLGVYDRTYVEGLRGSTGSSTILYDADDAPTRALLNSIFSNSTADTHDTIELYLNTATDTVLECTAFITQVGTPVSVGEVTACSVNFQITGPISGEY